MKPKKGRAFTENGGELYRNRGCVNREPIYIEVASCLGNLNGFRGKKGLDEKHRTMPFFFALLKGGTGVHR